MRRIAMLVVCGFVVASLGTNAFAGKKDGTKCRSSQSCSSKLCEVAPGDRFGVCCVRTTCAEVSAQCGTIDDGCLGIADCGGCGSNEFCTDTNVCSPNTMCGGWPVASSGDVPAGGYLETCSDCSVTDCTLSCTCLMVDQTPNGTSMDLTACDPATHVIENFNGTLTCYQP